MVATSQLIQPTAVATMPAARRRRIARPRPQPQLVEDAVVLTEDEEREHEKVFITANSQPTTLEKLATENIIPVFCRDNEVLISHGAFINAVLDAAKDFYKGEEVASPLIRVSHLVKGRLPGAIFKDTSELLPTDITSYWERMAFCINIPTIREDVNGNTLNLSIVGVKSYAKENLSGRLTAQRFSIAVSFNNQACCNQCIFAGDGYKEDIRATQEREIYFATLSLLQAYDMAKNISLLRALGNQTLTEHQFCQILGRMRLYSSLPASKQREIPQMLISDTMVNNVVRQYHRDDNFKANTNGEISLWNFYNLLTGAAKTSYIDTFLSRQSNVTEIVQGIASALNGEDTGYKWFLE